VSKSGSAAISCASTQKVVASSPWGTTSAISGWITKSTSCILVTETLAGPGVVKLGLAPEDWCSAIYKRCRYVSLPPPEGETVRRYQLRDERKGRSVQNSQTLNPYGLRVAYQGVLNLSKGGSGDPLHNTVSQYFDPNLIDHSLTQPKWISDSQ